MTKNGVFGELHTVACIDAAQGKAMYAGNQVQPNSEIWYALGLIYEQYGAKSAALEAYRSVQAHELDDQTYIDPTSTYLLAQNRIQALSK
jgi:hypothetical protein